MSDLNIKPLNFEDAKWLSGKFEITLKRDGTEMYWRDGNLISSRGIIRNDRFPHILKILKENKFPDCIGEMYIDKGNVFDVSTRENWHKAQYMPFKLLMKGDIDKLVTNLNSEFITPLIRFKTIEEGWEFVKKNREEGLVLKNDYEWYKLKLLQEAKIPIQSWEQGKQKGAFILENGSRISGTKIEFVKQYLEWAKQGKVVMAEIEYPFQTVNGNYFQPRLRRVFVR